MALLGVVLINFFLSRNSCANSCFGSSNKLSFIHSFAHQVVPFMNSVNVSSTRKDSLLLVSWESQASPFAILNSFLACSHLARSFPPWTAEHYGKLENHEWPQHQRFQGNDMTTRMVNTSAWKLMMIGLEDWLVACDSQLATTIANKTASSKFVQVSICVCS